MSAFSFDARRESFASAQNRFADRFIRNIHCVSKKHPQRF